MLSRAAWRAPGAALALALALGAAEDAAAQNVCGGDDPTNKAQPVSCQEDPDSAVNIVIDASNLAIAGAAIEGVIGYTGGPGSVSIKVTDSTFSMTRSGAYAVWGGADFNHLDLVVKRSTLSTAGQNAIYGSAGGSGKITIDLDRVTATATGSGSGVVFGSIGSTGTGAIDIDITGGTIATSGHTGTRSGVYARHFGRSGGIDIDIDGGAVVTTSGAVARGVWGIITHGGNAATLTVAVTDGAVTAEGPGGAGVVARHAGLGSIALTVGAEAKIEAPFAVGVDARLTGGANAAGRLVVTHGGTVKARDAGIVAWGARRSGHTSGAGANEADDAARTEPMIHVTSSGDVTVGESAMNAFIRAAIAGADEALSAGEKAVFDAVVAADSDALDTALAALPAADYDAAWQARARALSRSRGHAPTDAGALANRAAEEIMGLTRSGVRALALSHEAIAGHVRNGDGDGALSSAERTTLAAALTGGDLETALAALAADYTDAWKDTLREMAASYNAGDILVEVTGGTIIAEGDGVDARYALTHDRNGAIAVTVADGATVSGGRHGVHVGGAGLVAGSGNLRDQTVTVDGAVTGGTGAGVHLAGGGTVTVGGTGRVGATSGDGILSDGAGDLVVTVHGAVDGDVRADGGALTFVSRTAGTVTGTVHDPAGALTVGGSVGRLLYSAGGTVTVGATGEITGVAGEAIRSEAGDLSVTVAGTVTGDVRAAGDGALTLSVPAGGMVSGTAHGLAGPVTVQGSVGRLLYGADGAVTVGATGRITGVEGEAIRSASGALSVTVAGMVAGDVRALGAGDLTALVTGTVTGNIAGRGAGDHTVTVRRGGSVTGSIDLAASAVTVDGSAGRVSFDKGGSVMVGVTGRIAGIAGVGVRSANGDLTATVAGRVAGDILALGAGRQSVTVPAGGQVRSSIRLASAGAAATVDGSAGRVSFDKGGSVTVGATGRIAGIAGVGVRSADGDLTATVAGQVGGDILALGVGRQSVTVLADGAVPGVVRLASAGAAATVSGSAGRVQLDKGGSVTVGATGRVTGVAGESDAIRSEAGALSVTAAGAVTGDIRALGGGVLTLSVPEGGMVSGAAHGLAGPVTVDGSVGRLLYGAGGSVTVGATGRVTGVSGESDAIHSEAGALSVTAAGAVSGDIRASGGALTLSVPDGGVVSGTAHGLAGPVAVHGSVGRLVYGAGGSAMVGATGRVTGVAGESDAIRSEAGDLSVTAAGAVMGDIRVSDGTLALSVPAGGMVSGAAHGLAGPVTVDGSVGRLVYGAGGSAMVGATGRVTGVAGEPDAIRSEAGALSVTVAGAVTGGVRALGRGTHTVMVAQRGSVTGAVRLASGAVAVDGAVGGVLLDGGGSVMVGATGRVTGAAGEPDAIRSEAGDLSVTVAGSVSGGVRALGDGGLTALVTGSVAGGIAGLGAGDRMVTVAQGGSVAGGIDLAAGAVTVDGVAGRVRLERGGSVTVGAAGRLSGIDGVAVHGASGALRVVSAGRVEGDIVALGDRPAMVSIPRGGSVTGTVALAAAGGEVAVDGAAGRVRFERGGSAVVGAEGVIAGIDGTGISSESGALSVTVRRAEGERPLAATERIGGRIVAKDGAARIFLQAADAPRAVEIGPAGTRGTLPDGAFDLGLERDADGGVAIAPRHAPRARVYEALPSVLLGLSDTPARDDRLSAARGANGVWARVEVGGGAWEAARSTSTGTGAGVSYDRRGWSARSGFDAPVGEAAMVGVSAHRRQARATLADEDGRIDAAATGFGVSGSWLPGDGIYVDGQASASWFEADLRSGLRGALGLDRRGFGHALGVEAGRETPVGSDLTVTPRARLTGSRLEFDAFEDALGNPVSVDRARRLTGGAGALVEARPPGLAGSRLFGSLDVEREFSRETRVVVSESALVSEGPVGRLRVALGWSHEWGEGRHAAFAGARYAADAEGGQAWTAGLTLTARF